MAMDKNNINKNRKKFEEMAYLMLLKEKLEIGDTEAVSILLQKYSSNGMDHTIKNDNTLKDKAHNISKDKVEKNDGGRSR